MRASVGRCRRGSGGQHRGQQAVATTHISHRGHPVDAGLTGLKLGVRGLECCHVGAVTPFGGGLGSKLGLEIELRSGDSVTALHRLAGQLVEPG